MGVLIRWRGSGPQQVAQPPPEPTIKKLTDAAISARLLTPTGVEGRGSGSAVRRACIVPRGASSSREANAPA